MIPTSVVNALRVQLQPLISIIEEGEARLATIDLEVASLARERAELNESVGSASGLVKLIHGLVQEEEQGFA